MTAMTSNHFFIRLLLTLVLSSVFQFAYGEDFTLQGKVGRVLDGDTIELITSSSSKVKIRLLGIDAPESSQSFGKESTDNLKRLSDSRTVKAICIGLDRYRRSLCKIVVDDSDLNLEQVRSGLAWHYKAYSSSQSKDDQKSYAVAEIYAQNSKIGLWEDEAQIPPWDFRKGINNSERRNSDRDAHNIIKMSKSKICHAPGSRYYAKTTHFIGFSSIEACQNAGGRPPKSR
jgi:endonuclease YncB( thermonuclease family)